MASKEVKLSFPVWVYHHLAYVARTANGNEASAPPFDIMATGLQQATAESLTTSVVGVWQGNKAFSVKIGLPTTLDSGMEVAGTFASLPVGADTAIRSTWLLSTGDRSPSGVGVNNLKATMQSQYLANVVPSLKPGSFVTKQTDSIVIQLTPEQIAALGPESATSTVTFNTIDVARKALILANAAMTQMNSVLKYTPPLVKSYGTWVQVESTVTTSPLVKLTLNMTYNVETNELVFDTVDVADDVWQADVALINQQLLTQTKLYLDGDLKDTEIVVPTRPQSTYKPSVRDKLNGWWADVTDAYARLLGMVKPLSTARIAADVAGTATDYVKTKTQAVSTTESGTPLWQAAWTGIKDTIGSGASAIWDTITQWGPKEMAMGYAGYTAVESAKSSSIPSWLLIGGAGLAALAVLR